jgi:hypothetical protein
MAAARRIADRKMSAILSCDTPEVFEPTEHPLDDVAAFMRMLAGWIWRDPFQRGGLSQAEYPTDHFWRKADVR